MISSLLACRTSSTLRDASRVVVIVGLDCSGTITSRVVVVVGVGCVGTVTEADVDDSDEDDSDDE